MKKVIVLILLLSMLGLMSCSSIENWSTPSLITTSVPKTIEYPPITPTPTPTYAFYPTPSHTPLVINTEADLLKLNTDLVYPCAIIVDNCPEGYIVNEWLNRDRTPVFGHAEMDTMTIRIYNSHNEPAVFSLKYQDISDNTSYYSITDKYYYKAPPEAKNWLTIAYPFVSLQPHELASVPISLLIPVGASVPPSWEFQIVVNNDTFSKQIVTNSGVRYLITMMPQS